VPFWASIIGMQPYRQPWTQALAALALSMTVDVEMRLKHAFCCPRPGTLSPQIQPMVQVPGHASWPSGHATETFMIATVLQELLQHSTHKGAKYHEQLQRFAARVAVNRTVAGLHYPVDSAAGRMLGTALGQFFVARCRGDEVTEWGFDGRKFHGRHQAPVDFDLRVSMTDGASGYYSCQPAAWRVSQAPLLGWVWKQAAAEWK
jgi:membrane-associated phospholipid phosphatase